jgi:hypothetical protein
VFLSRPSPTGSPVIEDSHMDPWILASSFPLQSFHTAFYGLSCYCHTFPLPFHISGPENAC